MAERWSRGFLGHRLSSSLPRKIAFEGCEDDHVYAAINDIGWLAAAGLGRGDAHTIAKRDEDFVDLGDQDEFETRRIATADVNDARNGSRTGPPRR